MLEPRPPPPFPPCPWRPPEKRPVTLIAGLKCVDGIVLAADTEESTSLTRGRARKLLTRTFPKRTSEAKTKIAAKTVVVAIAGAGNAALIDSAVEQIFEAVSAAKGSTVRQLKKTISDALLHFYRYHVSAYPTRDPLDNIIDLICGVRAASGELTLYKASGPLLSTVTGFALCGSGEILRHIVEELYQPTIAVPRAVALTLHTLNLGKRYVAGVGGDSEILTLMADGIPTQEHVKGIKIKEHHLDQFNRLVGEVLLQFPDGSIAPDAFTAAMAQAVNGVETLRRAQLAELAAATETLPTSTASILSPRQPPGDAPTAPSPPGRAKRSAPRRVSRKKLVRRVPQGPKGDR